MVNDNNVDERSILTGFLWWKIEVVQTCPCKEDWITQDKTGAINAIGVHPHPLREYPGAHHEVILGTHVVGSGHVHGPAPPPV